MTGYLTQIAERTVADADNTTGLKPVDSRSPIDEPRKEDPFENSEEAVKPPFDKETLSEILSGERKIITPAPVAHSKEVSSLSKNAEPSHEISYITRHIMRTVHSPVEQIPTKPSPVFASDQPEEIGSVKKNNTREGVMDAYVKKSTQADENNSLTGAIVINPKNEIEVNKPVSSVFTNVKKGQRDINPAPEKNRVPVTLLHPKRETIERIKEPVVSKVHTTIKIGRIVVEVLPPVKKYGSPSVSSQISASPITSKPADPGYKYSFGLGQL